MPILHLITIAQMHTMFSSKINGFTLSFSFHGVCYPEQPRPMTISCNMGRKTNFYKVLSLESETVGADEIKKAYRRMARQWHPDVCPPSLKEESTRMFVELCRVYETLSDPVLRKRYDMEIKMNEERMVGMRFERETWEDQLRVLKMRSDRRMHVAL